MNACRRPGYTLVLAGLLITSGALADRFGRRRIFRIGLVLFALGSAGCALAPGLETLVAARVLQGLGGSMLSPVALAIVVSVITDPRERAQAIGIWAAVFGLSMAAGPVLGGALVAGLGWRAVFWANLPIIAIVLALTAAYVPESRSPRPRRLDPPGQVLLSILVAAVVAVLIEGSRAGWRSGWSIGAYAVIAASALAFARVEARRDEPLMDLSLSRRPPFAAAVAGAGTALGGALLAGLEDRPPLPVLLVAYLFVGIGVGFANAPITDTAVSGLPPARSGVAGGITSTARQVGAALGIALAGGLVAQAGPDGLAAATRPGWFLVVACGAILLLVAQTSRGRIAAGVLRH